MALICLFGARSAAADSAILIHGYLGSADSWRRSGVVAMLQRRGWFDAGHLRLGPRGVLRFGPRPGGANRLYMIDLPSEAPIPLQAHMLGQYMDFVAARHPKERLYLIGHSAGGVVGRFAMVTHRGARATGLITIASPHLGTSAAELGAMAADSPISWVAPFFGGSTINRSRELYNQLRPERPGTLLGWLNHQRHPEAKYVSIIRAEDMTRPANGDSMVLGWSQDMNNVAALRGKSLRVLSPGHHELRAMDGVLLANVLARL